MKLLESCKKFIKNNGYNIYNFQMDSLDFIGFEDASIFGFCSTFSSTNELIEQWKSREEAIFEKFELEFLGAGDKLWNAYSIFLCSDSKNSSQNRQIEKIEQNVELSRKIAASDITSEYDLENALLPLIPLQFNLKLPFENYQSRFASRLELISPELVRAILDPNENTSNIIKKFGHLR